MFDVFNGVNFYKRRLFDWTFAFKTNKSLRYGLRIGFYTGLSFMNVFKLAIVFVKQTFFENGGSCPTTLLFFHIFTNIKRAIL